MSIAERHEKFAKYWEEIGKPELEWYGSPERWIEVSNKESPPWYSDVDYRIKGDPHWELRRKWVDSDRTLLIEFKFESGAVWSIAQNPGWQPNLQYREAPKMQDGKWVESSVIVPSIVDRPIKAQQSDYTTDITEMQICKDGRVAANLKLFDDGGAEIEIKGVHNSESWAELSKVIADALKQMGV